MSNTYFISDTHFGHFNILKYCPSRVVALAEFLYNQYPNHNIEWHKNRINEIINGDNKPLKDVLIDYHDVMLVRNWNSVVKPDDTVWFLGDFGLGSKERAKRICSQLNGRKNMIRGNHDNWTDEFYRSIGFNYVSKYPVILKHKFVLSHAPLEAAQNNDDFFFIYGHIHENECMLSNKSNCYCVCEEKNNFTPVVIEAYNKTN